MKIRQASHYSLVGMLLFLIPTPIHTMQVQPNDDLYATRLYRETRMKNDQKTTEQIFKDEMGGSLQATNDDLITRYLTNEKKEQHPLVNPELRAAVVEIAQRINKEFPNDRIIAIGASPAYIIETARRLAIKNNQDSSRFGFVAFSGKTPYAIENLPAEKTWPIDPFTIQASAYKHYLTHIGITPERIVQDFKEHKRHTVFVDLALAGGGLMSFIGFLYAWAKQDKSININDFMQALKLIVFTNAFINDEEQSKAHLLKKLSAFHVLKLGLLKPEQITLIVPTGNPAKKAFDDLLVNVIPEKNWRIQDRLVVNYEPKDWLHVDKDAKGACTFTVNDPLQFTISPMAKALLFLLEQDVWNQE